MAANPSIQLGTDGNWAIKEDNLLAYKEDGTRFFNKQFDFTRGSLATFVDKDGLIKYSGFTNTELVTNGDFENGSASWTNASSDTFEVVNGGVGHNTSLHIVVSAINRGAYQSAFVSSKTYYISLDLKVVSGSVYIGKNTKKLNNQNYNNSDWQTITGYLTAIDDKIRIYGNEASEYYVDNVSVKEVGQNWTFGTGWSIDNGKAVKTSGTGSSLVQTVPTTTIGKKYKFTFDTIVTSGVANAALYGVTIPVFSTSGSQEHTIIATSTTGFNFFGDSLFEGSIDNISVIEVLGDKPRIDYSDSLTEPSLLLEPQSTNLLPYSEDFTEWIISPSTSQAVLAPTEAAPYGQGDVYEVTMQSSESDAYIRYSTTNATLTSSTHSVWVKQAPSGSATHIRLTNNNRAAWNTGTSEKIALTSSWQRLETTDSITGNRFTIIGSADVSGTQDPDCIGKALVYGAQLVEGSSAGAYRFTDGGATSNSTVIPNPTIPTQDIFGNAVRDRLNSFNLDGSGYAEVADDDSLNMSSGFSTSFWVKLDEGSTTTDYDFLVCKGRGVGGTNTAYGFGTTYYNNTIIATINTSVSKYQAISPGQTSTGQWVFVCVTYEPNTLLGLKLYLDDNSPNSITVSGTVDESHNLNVGRDSSFVTTRQSRNIISDVLFYDSVLTSDEVENNYNAGSSAHRN